MRFNVDIFPTKSKSKIVVCGPIDHIYIIGRLLCTVEHSLLNLSAVNTSPRKECTIPQFLLLMQIFHCVHVSKKMKYFDHALHI